MLGQETVGGVEVPGEDVGVRIRCGCGHVLPIIGALGRFDWGNTLEIFWMEKWVRRYG